MKDVATLAGKYVVADGSKVWNSGTSDNHNFVRRVIGIIIFLVGYATLWMILYNSSSLVGSPIMSHNFIANDTSKIYHSKLESVLSKASMENNTVIITNLNDAWAKSGSVFDLFLESFHIAGHQTEKLLNHLVVITWDQKAYTHCLSLHKHCYHLETKGDNFTSEAFFMTPNYIHMVWRKIEFLGSVLQMGYNFVFTDMDVMWFRDPFKRFYKNADIQMSCDDFNGNSYDIKNFPNTGFMYVKSNNRTIWFYKFWLNSSEATLKTQDVLNKIKMDPLVSEKKLKIRFLSTLYFGGFCQPSWDFKKLSTMHANCCVGLENKVNDLKLLLDDWRKYMTLSKGGKKKSHPPWSVPQSCSTSFQRSGLIGEDGRLIKLSPAKWEINKVAVREKPKVFKEKKE